MNNSQSTEARKKAKLKAHLLAKKTKEQAELQAKKDACFRRLGIDKYKTNSSSQSRIKTVSAPRP